MSKLERDNCYTTSHLSELQTLAEKAEGLVVFLLSLIDNKNPHWASLHTLCERTLFHGLYLIIVRNCKTIIIPNNSLN